MFGSVMFACQRQKIAYVLLVHCTITSARTQTRMMYCDMISDAQARPPKSLGVAQKGIIKPEHQVKKNRSVMFALSPQQPTTADGVPTSAPPDAHVFWQQYISQRQPVCCWG